MPIKIVGMIKYSLLVMLQLTRNINLPHAFEESLTLGLMSDELSFAMLSNSLILGNLSLFLPFVFLSIRSKLKLKGKAVLYAHINYWIRQNQIIVK